MSPSGCQDCCVCFYLVRRAQKKKNIKKKTPGGVGAKKKLLVFLLARGFFLFFFPSERWERKDPSGFFLARGSFFSCFPLKGRSEKIHPILLPQQVPPFPDQPTRPAEFKFITFLPTLPISSPPILWSALLLISSISKITGVVSIGRVPRMWGSVVREGAFQGELPVWRGCCTTKMWCPSIPR